ncbi:MAG: ATP synthase F1 subunit gamma [Clostridia bacterium]|nr:ATP synthase F1 subunit gamma [Clostridia bacterium]MBR6889601.1 ATP synthase F1 subunit gamma [Clostridia bacterium]
MAGASMKDIKLRIRSVESTMQITKAMQLVASSKLRGARARMEASRPYMKVARRAVWDIALHNTGAESQYVIPREIRHRCYIVLAGDRGLAGSYNANMFKRIEWDSRDANCCVIPIGRKAKEYYNRKGARIITEVDKVEGLTLEACADIAQRVLDSYDAGEYDEVVLAYTSFVSVLTQRTKLKPLLPLDTHDAPERTSRQMLCEPDADTLLKGFLPQYLAGLIYAAACDSFASEQAARRVAMDSATKNASEMIEDLSLRYNRARQSSITQELTEIVAGAEH